MGSNRLYGIMLRGDSGEVWDAFPIRGLCEEPSRHIVDPTEGEK